MEVHTIILAAGNSSRMGQPKQLLRINDEALLVRTIKTVTAAGLLNTEITVVLGSDYAQHRDVVSPLKVNIEHNINWADGMGSSLKYGLKKIMEQKPIGVLILVCDQPLLTPQHLQKIIQLFQASPQSIIASHYNNTNGVPAIFPSPLFDQLLMIGDEQGAKKVLQENQHNLISVDFPDGAIDLDTPEDYKNYNTTNH